MLYGCHAYFIPGTPHYLSWTTGTALRRAEHDFSSSVACAGTGKGTGAGVGVSGFLGMS